MPTGTSQQILLPHSSKLINRRVNLMSYDLHGVWDRDDPIGSIVLGVWAFTS